LTGLMIVRRLASGLARATDLVSALGAGAVDGDQAPGVRDAGRRRAARLARSLAWTSLALMCAEGAIGL
jgi:hypothetical protein